MRIYRCDVCNKDVANDGLWNVDIGYRIDDIEHMCRNCYENLQKKLKEVKEYYDKLRERDIKTYFLAERIKYKKEE